MEKKKAAKALGISLSSLYNKIGKSGNLIVENSRYLELFPAKFQISGIFLIEK